MAIMNPKAKLIHKYQFEIKLLGEKAFDQWGNLIVHRVEKLAAFVCLHNIKNNDDIVIQSVRHRRCPTSNYRYMPYKLIAKLGEYERLYVIYNPDWSRGRV